MHKRLLTFIWFMLFSCLSISNSSIDIDKIYREYRDKEVMQIIYRYHYDIKAKDTIIKIYDYASKYNISFEIFTNLVYNESSFDSMATSYKGAKGLCQIMPKTARQLANLLGRKHYNLYNRDDNLELGAFYLSLLLNFCQPDEALARYYAGKNWGSYVTSNYVKSILIFF